MKRTLQLIRGLPGSGKTTAAQQMMKDYPGISSVHFEADQFFDGDGQYIYLFKPELLSAAHAYCQHRTELAMMAGKQLIIVSNTFTTIKEMKPYVDLALDYCYTLRVMECTSNFKSVHDVPEQTIERMRQRWEQVPSYWFTKQ